MAGTTLEWMHAASVVLGIAGAACVARGLVLLGQALWIPANVLWIVWCATMGDWWGAALFALYLLLAVAGVVRSARWAVHGVDGSGT